MDQQDFNNLIKNYMTNSQFGVYAVPYHTHNGTDSPLLQNTGTVTNVSVASANGFSGTVASSSTTPVITISTTVSGILQGNGTSITGIALPSDATKFLNGTGAFSTPPGGTVTNFLFTNANSIQGTVATPTTTPTLSLSITTSGILRGQGAGNPLLGSTIPNDATQFLNGALSPVYAQVKDSDLSVSNVTTNNVTASQHGFIPKYPNNTTTFFRGDGTYASPPSGGTFSFISPLTTSSSTTNQNIDTVFTAGFQANVITIYYVIKGFNSSTAQTTNGIALYSGSTLVVNQVYDAQGNGTTTPITQGTMTFVATGPTAGGASGGNQLQVDLTVNAVTATTFTIRIAYTNNSGGPTATSSFVAVATG